MELAGWTPAMHGKESTDGYGDPTSSTVGSITTKRKHETSHVVARFVRTKVSELVTYGTCWVSGTLSGSAVPVSFSPFHSSRASLSPSPDSGRSVRRSSSCSPWCPVGSSRRPGACGTSYTRGCQTPRPPDVRPVALVYQPRAVSAVNPLHPTASSGTASGCCECSSDECVVFGVDATLLQQIPGAPNRIMWGWSGETRMCLSEQERIP